MEVNCYINSADKRVVDKSDFLSRQQTRTAWHINRDFSVTNPILDINIGVYGYTLDINYIYIPLYKRYYYVDKYEITANNMTRLYCSVDSLMSYKDYINNLYCNIIRQENIQSTYIIDNNLPIYSNKSTECIKLNSSDLNLSTSANENTFNFVINVAGGSQSEN